MASKGDSVSTNFNADRGGSGDQGKGGPEYPNALAEASEKDFGSSSNLQPPTGVNPPGGMNSNAKG